MTIADLYNALEKAVDSGLHPNDSVIVDCGVFGYMDLQRLIAKTIQSNGEKEKVVILKIKGEI